MDEIEWSMLQGFLRSLRHHVREEEIEALASLIGAALREAGVSEALMVVERIVPKREPLLP